MTAPDLDIAGRMDGAIHRLPVRVYWEDTDAGGIVYHASYVRFLERGRSDFLRHLGIVQSRLAEGTGGVLFAVRTMTLDFLRPARLDDLVEVTTRAVEISGARLGLAQAVRRAGEDLLTATVTVAAIAPNGRPRRIPSDIARLLTPAPPA